MKDYNTNHRQNWLRRLQYGRFDIHSALTYALAFCLILSLAVQL